MNQPNVERKCLFSGETFIPKRNNQVFASTKNRINYHNKKNNKLRNELKSINNQLFTNYKICMALLGRNNSVEVHREYLLGRGYDFRYFTNLEDSKNSVGLVYGIFEISIQKLDENYYKITRL
jgi:hypothetical protein